MKKGYFISFEGIDGSGKSTQINRLADFLSGQGYEVVLTREPGGTEIGEKIRSIILDPQNTAMADMTEAFLYAASRAQHVREVIMPAVESGRIVICDRFIDSSIAYQGYGRGLGDCIEEINRYAVHGCMPDMTFLMKIGTDVSSGRISGRSPDRIEMEDRDFYEKVNRGYERLSHDFPDRVIAIDASRSVDEIEKDIAGHVRRLIVQERR